MDSILHAWCIMPNHVHFLVEGAHECCDLVAFVKLFKQETGYEFKSRFQKQLWQRSFYDHALRPDDGLDSIAAYIWMNPVRQGLCDLPGDYPFSGSLTMQWKQAPGTQDCWMPPWRARRGEASASPGRV